MKIGIITLWHGNNYGGALQAYALQTYLARQGHASAILPVQHEPRRVKPLKKLVHPVRSLTDAIRNRQFRAFRGKHFDMAGMAPTPLDEFLRAPPRFDAYVCGSDQVWNPGTCSDRALRRLFFLDFGDAAARRVSYAASWGATSLDAAYREEVHACLRRFTAISVRERSGVGIVAELGLPSTWLPDPTLLLEPANWTRLAADEPRAQGDGALFQCEYRWTPCIRFAEIRRVLEHRYGWRTVIPFSDHPIRDAAYTRCLTPSQWVDGIRRSSFVLTNSFHGMVFSVIFRRPFLAIPLRGKYAIMNERVLSLAERLGLQERVLSGTDARGVIALAEKPVDWDAVAQRLRDWQQEAHDFITAAFG